MGVGPEELAAVAKRLSLVTADDGIVTDDDGNVTIMAPSAVAGSAVVVSPTRSELLAGMCKNCKGPFSLGIEVQCPPPHNDADPIRVCAECLMRLWAKGRVFKMDWV